MKKTKDELYLKINLSFFADSGDKTEEPTAKRKEKSREEGQVAQSQEVGTAFLFLAVFYSLDKFAPDIYQSLLEIFTSSVNLTLDLDYIFNVQFFSKYIAHLFGKIILISLPIFLIAMVVGVTTNIVQVGFKVTTKPLEPKFSKLNPLTGIKKLFSVKQLVDLVKALAKMALIGYVIYSTIKDEINGIYKLIDMEIMDGVMYIGKIIIDLGTSIGTMFLLIAAADFAYQKFKHLKDIKMSKQEIKDEYKEAEGNPQMKGAIRQRMREVSMRRMMSDLETADVIITNPTHFAVALRYDQSKEDAPVVVAKGADFIAERIKEIAGEKKIEIIENKMLARTLYSSCKIGGRIPPELYQAVAEILAFVYKSKNTV